MGLDDVPISELILSKLSQIFNFYGWSTIHYLIIDKTYLIFSSPGSRYGL